MTNAKPPIDDSDHVPEPSPRRARQGVMLVVSSPSGAGKTSLCKALLAQDANLRLSISATTRPRRSTEQDGRDYHFLSEDAFAAKQAQGAFLESAQVFGFAYGTLKAQVLADMARGQDVLFDVDWQGAAALAASLPEHVVQVFIVPPTLETLLARLRSRQTDSEEIIAKRMDEAAFQVSCSQRADYVLVNDDFELCLSQLQAVLTAARLSRARALWLSQWIKRLE